MECHHQRVSGKWRDLQTKQFVVIPNHAWRFCLQRSTNFPSENTLVGIADNYYSVFPTGNGFLGGIQLLRKLCSGPPSCLSEKPYLFALELQFLFRSNNANGRDKAWHIWNIGAKNGTALIADNLLNRIRQYNLHSTHQLFFCFVPLNGLNASLPTALPTRFHICDSYLCI